MQEIIYKNKDKFEETLYKIKKDWFDNLHILADFDNTLTKAFSAWKKRPSLISVLRDEWYLDEDYSKKAHELFNYYNPIEKNPNISIEEKKKEMTNWRKAHFDLLLEKKLNKKDIEKIIESKIIELRTWVKDFLVFLSKNNIPLVIISANWLWADSIEIYLKKEGFFTKNVKIISNKFEFDNSWKAINYDKRIIHSLNKDETILNTYPEIYKEIEKRKNVILLGDSIWDAWMIEWFEYESLLKIWFYNEENEKLLDEYIKNFDLVLTWDNNATVLKDLF